MGPRNVLPLFALVVSIVVGTDAGAGVAYPLQSNRAKNTVSNIAPTPNFMAVCTPGGFDESAPCMSAIDAAFQNALSTERVPINFNAQLLSMQSPSIQLFIAANIDRIARGLPPFEDLLGQLNTIARRGVARGTDPTIAESPDPQIGGQSVIGWGSNWGRGTYNALGTEYFWMYEDGVNGYNVACSGSRLDGCQGHRANILATYAKSKAYCTNGKITLSMGSAFAMKGGTPSFGEIFIATCNAPVGGIVTTWNQVKRFAALSNSPGNLVLGRAGR